MSAGVKAAAFAALVRVFMSFHEHGGGPLTLTAFSMLAFLTMVVGNLLAIPQRNVKRMLAYSSIAHAGYLLVGVAALFAQGGPSLPGLHVLHGTNAGLTGSPEAAVRAEALRGILFYLLAYTLSVVGAFGALSALERRENEERGFGWDLDRFAGLVSRRPGWAVAMAVFMLSLGGIPPTVGFMGKLFIFRAGVDAGLVGLVLVGVITSAAGAYYYLRVVVYMFMRPAPEGVLAPERHWGTELVLWVSTAAVVILGVLPGGISTWFAQAGTLFGGSP
jgi:NADH-quinone oxidoreductase subunit N